MTMRAFARAKDQYDNAKSKTDLPSNAMIDLVEEIEFEAVGREIEDESS